MKSHNNNSIKIKTMKKVFLILGIAVLVMSCDNSATENATTEPVTTEEVVGEEATTEEVVTEEATTEEVSE